MFGAAFGRPPSIGIHRRARQKDANRKARNKKKRIEAVLAARHIRGMMFRPSEILKHQRAHTFALYALKVNV